MRVVSNHEQWDYSEACLTLRGVWQANQVARAWRELPVWQGVQRVDLSGITQMDSSLIALLVELRTRINQTLLLSGVSDVITSLLGLYEVGSLFFEVEHHE